MNSADIPQFPYGHYVVNVSWRYLESHLESWNIPPAPVDLNPDFQRAHVWTEEQQRRYVEFQMRGGRTARRIVFNCPGWNSDWHGPFVIVDGKQRLEAVRKFMRNELAVFDGHKRSDFVDDIKGLNINLEFEVNNLQTRAEVLQWYLDFNSGGVVHTEDELNRVRDLLAKEKAP